MQERLFETKLTKEQRKAAGKHLKEYFTLPSRIESKRAMAEMAATKMTPGYNPSEVQTHQAPSSKVERYALTMSEVEMLLKRYTILCRIHESLIDDQQRLLWELLYDPKYFRSDDAVMHEMRISSTRTYYGIKNKLLGIVHDHFGDGY
ncbi:hypothetical protein ADM98_11540 [Exiguobacterium sp. BMC-KP]|uniref:hypothetical protein n=1 Tax=Exiguobacterium sp. BMC-KP TaxID=1684312 RepID=UPI0006AA14B9|nr:hypothetical protein [Exiguobacterium sp. BMC-KP]KOP29497.1 hypothetical protein ADM98_11540 [Exiguobacterium sp. BMC-KP]